MYEVLRWLDRRARLATLLHSNRVELTTSLDYTFEPYLTAKPIALITSTVNLNLYTLALIHKSLL